MFKNETRRGLNKGNPKAYKEVFRILYPRLKGYCSLFVNAPEEVEDIIQECFLSLWENRASIDSSKKIESLLFVMARNRCLNHLKKQQLSTQNIRIENIADSDLQHLYQIDLLNKEEQSLEELMVASFKNAVDKLPSKMKMVFVSCKLEGKKQKDVAKELGISLKMVEKHIARAKDIISNQLELQYPALIFLITSFMN